MNCYYCNASNGADDHRCGRCGRRLSDSEPTRRPEPQTFNHDATARAFDRFEAASESPAVDERPKRPQLVTELARVTELPRVPEQPAQHIQPPDPSGEAPALPRQVSLFGPVEVRRPGLGPVAPPSPSRRKPSKAPAADRQQPLFEPTIEAPLPASPSTQAPVYANAPVAYAAHRILAASIDSAVVFTAIGVFLLSCHIAAPELASSAATVSFAIAALLIAVFYRVIFCIANTDTIGAHAAGLRLLNFDNRTPTRSERFARIAASLVSFLSIGIGFFWALVDEERFAWHDYMSKTFPSPR